MRKSVVKDASGGSWKVNEVAGFVVFSQQLLIGYLRLGKVNINDCPAGLENQPRRVWLELAIGEKVK